LGNSITGLLDATPRPERERLRALSREIIAVARALAA
jgi:hypothetical protein